MIKHAFTGSYAMQAARGAQGMLFPEDRLCAQSHYAAIVEAQKDVEIYQLGDLDCPECLRHMAEKHAALAEVFRARLVVPTEAKRCRVYDTACINPIYCAAHDACCAGDPACRAPSGTTAESPRALCHGCSEMVEVIDGKLSPHHGVSGDGCPLNDAIVQIYLHPLVADRIAHLEAALVFGAPGGDR